MVPLVMGGVLVATLLALLLPVPVWTSRALRGRKAQLALPPATIEVGAELEALHREVGIALDLVRNAASSMADYAASSLWVRLMDRGPNDNWAKSVVRRALYDEGEAYQAVGRVIEAGYDLPERERERLDAQLTSLASGQRSLDGTVAADVKPGSHPRARDLRDRQKRLARLESDLHRLLVAITAPPDDPYR